MKRIYLSGPMTGMPNKNFPAFNAEAKRLRLLGYEVVNPVEINGDAAVNQGRTHIECLRNDVAGLATCDTLAMLPMPNRQHRSKGMEIEIDVAKLLEIEVVHASRITEPCADRHLYSQGAIEDLFRRIGKEMVDITTTLQGPEEWPAIPALWQHTMRERDRYMLRVRFLTEPGKPRKVEEHKGLYRVYLDESKSYDDHAKWRAMTSLYYPSAGQAIDEAMKAVG